MTCFNIFVRDNDNIISKHQLELKKSCLGTWSGGPVHDILIMHVSGMFMKENNVDIT